MARWPRIWFETAWSRILDRTTAKPATAATRSDRVHTALFVAWTVVVAGAYLAVQLLYVRRLPLVMDEFDGAYDVYRLRNEIPYVDFQPYKTVLGYYLQLPPLLLAPNVWSGLLKTKFMLAWINAAGMAAAAVAAARRFRPGAVALALPLWAVMSNWLERSSELRVDTLTSFFGLFSLLLLLAGRWAGAGVVAALSFLVSQKGVYFLAASLVALGLPWVRTPRVATLRRLLRFCAGYAAPIVSYLVAFSSMASWDKTASTTFLRHRAIALTVLYPHIRKFWTQSLERNPVFYALALAGLLALGVRALRGWRRRDGNSEADRDLALLGYAIALGACLIWHKQPWPYFFVLLVPTCFLLHAVAFEDAWRVLVALVRPRWARIAIGVVLCAGVLRVGVASPATRVSTMLRQDNRYQRHMVKLASALLRPDERYLSGVDLLYDRKQSSEPLRRVSHPRRAQLRHADRTEIMALLDDLRAHPPKLVIRHERYRSFPLPVRRFLEANYADFWGSIRIYAPGFQARSHDLTLAFSGAYRVSTRDASNVMLNGRWLAPGATVSLARGRVQLRASSAGRLTLTAPEVASRLDRRYRRLRPLFPAIYSR